MIMLQNDTQPIRELKWLAQFFDSHGHDKSAREIFKQIKKVRKTAQSSLNGNDASNVVDFAADKNLSEAEQSRPLTELRWMAQFFNSRGHYDSAREIDDQLKKLGQEQSQSAGSRSRASHSIYDSAQAMKEVQWLAKFFTDHGDKPGCRRIALMLRTARKTAQAMLNESDASDITFFGGDDSNKTRKTRKNNAYNA